MTGMQGEKPWVRFTFKLICIGSLLTAVLFTYLYKTGEPGVDWDFVVGSWGAASTFILAGIAHGKRSAPSRE